MRKHRSLPGSLFGCLLGFAFLSLPAAAQTSAPNEWTWMGGSSTVSNGGQPGVFGTLGTPAAGNIPGSRIGAASWTDSSGNLWLFGGLAYDTNGNYGYLNDLWEFNPSTNEWAWMGGSSTFPESCYGCIEGQSGVYGTLGTPAAGNIPGGRSDASSWIDSSGHPWIFGGFGADASGSVTYLNDLWEFNPSTSEWTWMGGSSIVGEGQLGVYGTLGIPAAGNIPEGRSDAASWIDSSGNVWLFGGIPASFGTTVIGYALLNDLWEFNFYANEWTWMGGIDGFSVNGGNPGVYGTLGTPAAGNIPGNRGGASSWIDGSDHFWLFGGTGDSGIYDSTGNLNDLWKFDPSTNGWVWMGGSNTIVCGFIECGQPGVFGTMGVFAASNIPSSQSDAMSWTDNNGHVWLFGGAGGPPSGNYAALNDLWEFDPLTNAWAWMGGNSSTGSNCTSPDPISGRFTCGQPGVYGTLGTTANGNNPGARSGAASWTDNEGRLWLFGGLGFDENGKYGSLNDLWEYQPSAIQSLPTTATPIFSPATGTYSTTQTVTITDATLGAAIYYTTDGITTPTINSTQYTGPIVVMATETIQAVAVATNFVNSAVASAVYTINLPPPDFTVSTSLASLTVVPGQIVVKATVTPLNGFNSAVSFSCTSGLPAGATCSFFPATVTPSGAPASTALTVTTAAASAALHRKSSPLFPGSALAVALCCLGWKKRRRLPMLLLLAVSVVGMGLLNGCGASPVVTSSEPVTSTVTVTATSGSLSHTATFSLTIN
jgi:N-acetylneuraminic acid mutarotase